MNTFTPIINCFSPFFIYLSLQVCKSFIMSVNGIDCEYRLLYRAKKHRKRIWKMFLKNTHRIMCWWTTRASESFDVWFRISTVVDGLKIEMGISAACREKNWLATYPFFFCFFFCPFHLLPFSDCSLSKNRIRRMIDAVPLVRVSAILHSSRE